MVDINALEMGRGYEGDIGPPHSVWSQEKIRLPGNVSKLVIPGELPQGLMDSIANFIVPQGREGVTSNSPSSSS